MRYWLALLFLWVSAVQGQVLVRMNPSAQMETLYAWASDHQAQVEPVCKEWNLYRLLFKEGIPILDRPSEVADWQVEKAVQRRYNPNDPLVALQKYLPLIQADRLWDYQRTHLNRRGEPLVIALIDDGLDTSHPDLVDNLWVNSNEIPWNGLDDDQNGYVDDYYGWNSGDQSPEVFNDESVYYEHGTMVAGIAGAKGDNGIGVTGLVPTAKLLPILCYPSNGVDTDLGVIRGMIYAYRQKRLWLESGGTAGIPISVLNMSVGMDNAFPEDAPLWCSLFDSLGSVGILSIAATTNQNVDIGSSGDIPSLCSSRYLLVVSNSDTKDQAIGSGYSAEFVDLAAPGEGVHTTRVYSKNTSNPYKNGGGTSFAAPQVSGTALLMHAESCLVYLNLREQNPDSALRLMRTWILQGTDTSAAFRTRTASGGRLNAYRAFESMHEWCMQHDPVYGHSEPRLATGRMYPNPSLGSIHFEGSSGMAHLRICNAMGQVLHSGPMVEDLDLSGWPAGCYQVEIQWQSGHRQWETLLLLAQP